MDSVGLALPSGERRKTVKVVPLSWVIWITSALFAGWNIVGYRLLDAYMDQKFAQHNGDSKAHQIIVDRIMDRQETMNRALLERLDDINTRLSRIEGALQNGRK